MNSGDIKLIIDRLNNIDNAHRHDQQVTVDSAITALVTLGIQVAAQAAVIDRMRGYFTEIIENSPNLADVELAQKAFRLKTDSKLMAGVTISQYSRNRRLSK